MFFIRRRPEREREIDREREGGGKERERERERARERAWGREMSYFSTMPMPKFCLRVNIISEYFTRRFLLKNENHEFGFA